MQTPPLTSLGTKFSEAFIAQDYFSAHIVLLLGERKEDLLFKSSSAAPSHHS
jgi:hypothetical protein